MFRSPPCNFQEQSDNDAYTCMYVRTLDSNTSCVLTNRWLTECLLTNPDLDFSLELRQGENLAVNIRACVATATIFG